MWGEEDEKKKENGERGEQGKRKEGERRERKEPTCSGQRVGGERTRGEGSGRRGERSPRPRR